MKQLYQKKLQLGWIWCITIHLGWIKYLFRFSKRQLNLGCLFVTKRNGAIKTRPVPNVATGTTLNIHTQPNAVLVIVYAN